MELQHMKLQILEVGLLIISAYGFGKLAKKLKLGEVIGQIAGGIFIGPNFLKLIRDILQSFPSLENYRVLSPVFNFFQNSFKDYEESFHNFHFFVFLFLGLIAFSLGEELHIDRLKKVGIKATFICVLQAILTWVVLTLCFYFIFDFTIISSLLIGSIGIATAPALTFILMNKLKIEGQLKNLLANIVVLDDIIEVIFFSIFLGIALLIQDGKEITFFIISSHVLTELFFASFIGFIIFVILKYSLKKRLPSNPHIKHHEHGSFLSTVLSEHPTPSVEIFLIMTGVISIGIAVAIHFQLPFLITAVVAGFLISNFHSHAIFDSLKIGNVMPIFNITFFALIGANVRLDSFSKESFFLVLSYLLFRTFGKLAGNWIGCKITNQDEKITACLPKLMLPQAGMAAVETILVATLLKGEEGVRIFNTIIPALVVFELGGAWLSEKTLLKWKNWTTGESKAKSDGSSSIIPIHKLIGDRVFELDSKSKEDVLRSIAKYFTKEGFVTEETIISNPALEREKLASTAIGERIALPHCRISNIVKTSVACAILKNPVEWKAPDHQKVSVVFFILTPEEFPEQHLDAIRSIVHALNTNKLKKHVLKAVKTTNIKSYLQENEC